MDMIIYQDGFYELITVTKDMFEGVVKPEIVDCFSLCDVLRDKFTTYLEEANRHVMKDGGAFFYGCMCS